MAYGPKIIDHYENPRNVGSFGTQAEIKQRKDEMRWADSRMPARQDVPCARKPLNWSR